MLVGASMARYARALSHHVPNKVIPEPNMLPNHDQCCVYFPTVLHGLLGRGNSLYTEYKQSKALGESLVTKTASKVKKSLADFDGKGKVDLILVTHAAGDTKVGGGSWLYTPTTEAATIAQDLVRDVGVNNLKKTNIWLWVCEAAVSGAGLAFRNAIPTATVGKVFAPSENIEAIGLFLKHYKVGGADSFTVIR